MQICTVEKQMERRTSCLQANVEFLQDALLKLSRETQAKIDSEEQGACRRPHRDWDAAIGNEKAAGELAKSAGQGQSAGQEIGR